ncbi:MAG: MBL fold metallo-hydrolase [Ignavibacteria bacterium]|nr:MBL fold metallo-hydrolase [Ignavibacteria bacterium]
MITKTFTVNPFSMNCYVYWDNNTHEGVLIDPGAYESFEKQNILQYISSNKIDIIFILLTHGHIDHIMGNKWAKENFNVPVYMNKEDLPLIERALEQGEMFGVSFPQPPIPDKYINEGDLIKFGKTEFKLLHTPGHSPGSICFVDANNKVIFGGDTVFQGSIGRTDLWKGDIDLLLNSINSKIMTLPDEYIIYPGHMGETTVGFEKKNNPFLNGEYDRFV